MNTAPQEEAPLRTRQSAVRQMVRVGSLAAGGTASQVSCLGRPGTESARNRPRPFGGFYRHNSPLAGVPNIHSAPNENALESTADARGALGVR